jgi:hypothetical protein
LLGFDGYQTAGESSSVSVTSQQEVSTMTIAESILPEFEHEMAGTRKTLERIPDDKLDWKAHPKSNTIGWVAAHLVEIPGWVEGTLTMDEWDVNPVGGEPYRTPKAPAARSFWRSSTRTWPPRKKRSPPPATRPT